MSKSAIIQKLEKNQIKKDLPRFGVGDTIRVHTRIIEGNKERIQVFQGTVISRKGTGSAETMTLHRVAYGEGMERIFLVNSPRIAKIELLKEGQVRRGKLYHLRGTSGKKAKVKGRVTSRHKKFENEDKVQQEQEETQAVAEEVVKIEEVVAEAKEETTSAPIEETKE